VLRLSARLHLLWLVVEDSIRKETNFSRAEADHWLVNLGDLAKTIQPLEKCVAGVADRPGARRYRLAITYINERIGKTFRVLDEPKGNPVDQIFSALNHVGRARAALLTLHHDLVEGERGESSIAGVRQPLRVPHCEAGPELRAAFERTAAVRWAGDDQARCTASRDLYLALYRSMTYDEPAARAYYLPSLKAHTDLLEAMAPGVGRGCVTARLDVMKRLSPDAFEAEAFRFASQR